MDINKLMQQAQAMQKQMENASKEISDMEFEGEASNGLVKVVVNGVVVSACKGNGVELLLGEMRDIETISTAITAAETGHLLLSSLHTLGAAKTIDRVIDAFPANQQNQIRAQLSMVLRAVVSQRLILTKDGSLQPVFEVMCVNPAIQNLIREGKTHQIDNAIFGGGADMLSMDTELARLLRDDRIDREQAVLYAIHPETVERQARFIK